jgi:hypothetical protein
MTTSKIISAVGRRLLSDEESTGERYGFLQTIANGVLIEIATGKVDAEELARIELASRGIGQDSQWAGFAEAHRIWNVA